MVARREAHFYFPPNIRALLAVTIATRPSFTSGNPQTLQGGGLKYVALRACTTCCPTAKGSFAVVPLVEPSMAPPTGQINIVLNWFEELKAKVPPGNR